MEFSKLLTWIILGIYFSLIIIVGTLSFFFDKNISFILDYVQPIAICVVFSYFGKSGVENLTKIKTWGNPTSTQNTITEVVSQNDINGSV